MNMLTSSNQYLRPEYLSPLPTTLDAKKSPLALLAQTCSNIGADNPNNKPIIPQLEKAKDLDKSKESKSSSCSSSSSTSSCEDKSSFKPYVDKKEDSEDCHKKTPNGSKAGSPVLPGGSCSPAANSCGKASPANSIESNHGKSVESGIGSSAETTPTTLSLSSSANSGSQSTLSGLGYGSSLGLDLGRLDPTKDGLTAMTHLALGAYKHGSSLNSLANCVGCGPGHMSQVDGSAASHAYAGGLSSQATSPLKPGYSPMSPYVGYARVKTASGGTTLVPVCRDPYCTNCQFSVQSAQLTVCPSGCTQCNHDRLPVVPQSPLSGLGPAALGLTGPTSPAAGPPGLNSQLYPHSMLARPNVCSWMVGDTYCGKRFTSSEELLQHLRTHTNLTASDSGLPLLSSAGLAPPPPPPPATSAAWSAACHLHYSTAASLSTQAGLRRTYPTSLSPVSSLSAAARYHPYKAPVPTFPGAPLPPLPHPGLGLYYSPYGIYGQRLGPPVHP